MSVEILYDNRDDERSSFACFICNTSMTAFGPVFVAREGWDAREVAAAFEVFCGIAGYEDVRRLSAETLESAYEGFLQEVLPNHDLMLKYVEDSY